MQNKFIAKISDRTTSFKMAICRHESGVFLVGYEAQYVDPDGVDLVPDENGEFGHTAYGLYVFETLEDALASVEEGEYITFI